MTADGANKRQWSKNVIIACAVIFVTLVCPIGWFIHLMNKSREAVKKWNGRSERTSNPGS